MHTRTVGPFQRILAGFLNALFPPACPICLKQLWRTQDKAVCTNCERDLKLISPPSCIKCGRQFKDGGSRNCQDCITSPPSYRYMRAACVYQGRLRQAILDFKMNRSVSRAAPLAGLLLATETMGIDWESYDLVLPVPLHKNRLKWRGFNQCTLLIKEIATFRNIIWSDQLLLRTRDTTPQVELDANKRLENVKGAFECAHLSEIKSATILLVDDITATGATVAECSKILSECGAAMVDVAVLARPVTDFESAR